MPLSNLQSFHHGLILQNATAFPAAHYRAVNNQSAVIMAACPSPAIINPHAVAPLKNKPETTAWHVIRHTAPAKPVPETAPTPHPTPATELPSRKPAKKRPLHNTLLPAPVLLPLLDTQPIIHPHPVQDELPAPPEPNTRPHQVGKKHLWKPGHGVIEKVDKLTGEIVHLAEECLQSGRRQKIYLA